MYFFSGPKPEVRTSQPSYLFVKMRVLMSRTTRVRRFSSATPSATPDLSLCSLTAISGIDGRYGRVTTDLRPHFSEFGLIKQRLRVEIEYLKVLASEPAIREVPELSVHAIASLTSIYDNFDVTEAENVKKLEAATNHDVKAVEYYMKEKFASSAASKELLAISEFTHFACTSEDVSNLAYACLVKEARHAVMLPMMRTVVDSLASLGGLLADTPVMSRTHGQPATPTTMGKEMVNFAARLDYAANAVADTRIRGKFNGAVGSYGAHLAAYPSVPWEAVSRRLVEGRLGLGYSALTTQIEPHDWVAELYHALSRYNNILLGLDRDVWGYISLGYFRQRTVAGEIGSSTMPHKVNPIDFENSEGNLGIANAVAGHLAEKLTISRWQRDLSDSTVLRNMGVAFAHSLIAYKSTLKGLGKLQPDAAAMAADLDCHWELLAEPIQTLMRKYGAPKPYEQLKELTRGHGSFSASAMRAFIDKLEAEKQIPVEAAAALRALTPATYTGIAGQLTKRWVSDYQQQRKQQHAP